MNATAIMHRGLYSIRRSFECTVGKAERRAMGWLMERPAMREALERAAVEMIRRGALCEEMNRWAENIASEVTSDLDIEREIENALDGLRIDAENVDGLERTVEELVEAGLEEAVAEAVSNLKFTVSVE